MDTSSMATDDIIDDIDKEPEEVNEEKDIIRRFNYSVNRIDEIKKTVIEASDNVDPETLSKALVILASENTSLGVIAANLTYHAKLALLAYENARNKKKLDYLAKMSVAKAETQAKIETQELLNNAHDVQLMADEADSIGYRTDSFMKMSQSRLSLVKNDAIHT